MDHRSRDRVERKRKYQRLNQSHHALLGREAPCPTPHKFPFASRKRAKIGKRNTPTGEHLAIYKCACGAYHLGKTSFTREQARTAWEKP